GWWRRRARVPRRRRRLAVRDPGAARRRPRTRLEAARRPPGANIYCAPVPRASAIRATAWSVVAIGVAAPLVRKRVRAPAVVLQSAAFAAPLGLCVALRRSRARDVAACCLQMWAYVA